MSGGYMTGGGGCLRTVILRSGMVRLYKNAEGV